MIALREESVTSPIAPSEYDEHCLPLNTDLNDPVVLLLGYLRELLAIRDSVNLVISIMIRSLGQILIDEMACR